ncbi:MAG: nuclear transport factor 2 family protein [Cyanobacteria bacterium J06576_12]
MNTIAHPNVTLIQQLNPADLAASSHLFTERFVWHFFNRKLVEVQGDYKGVEGLKMFFERIQLQTESTFLVEPVSLTPVGDELVIAHVVDRMVLNGKYIELDAIVIWRIVDGLIDEAWDVPSLYVDRTTESIKPSLMLKRNISA